MTFWQLISNNLTKISGTVSTLLATLMTLIASGAFEGLLDPSVIKWLGIAGMLVGSITTGVGFNNSSKEKVASAMETAINARPGQRGFARPLMLALLLATAIPAVLSVQGCASIGLQSPINLTQRIDNAYGNVTAVVNTAIAGRERGQLTSEEGVFISDLAKNARVVLQAADTLNKVGDTSGAEGRLLLALGILQQLDNYLNGKKVTP